MDVCTSGTSWFLSHINENVLLRCITSLVFLCVFLFVYIIKTYTFFSKQNIPEGKTPTFPFGNFKDVVFQETTFYEFIWKNHHKFKRKGCKYGGIYLFLKPAIVVVDACLIQKVLSDENMFTFSHDKRLPIDYAKIIKIFNSKNSNNFLSNFEQSSITETLKVDLCKDDFENVLRVFFIQTTSLAFGFNAHELLNDINDELKKHTESSFWHFLHLIYPRFKRNCSNSDLKDILEEIWHVRKKNDIRKDDLIQSFFDLTYEEKWELGDVATEVFEIFVENLIYSYSATTLCLLELTRNIDIQEELIGEIRRFRNEYNDLNVKNVLKLTYLDSVVKETLRKYPPVPLLLMQNKDNYILTDKRSIQKGTFVILSIFGIHYNPDNYTDPTNFDPDRFLEDKKDDKNNFLPFGVGQRSDIGMNFTTLTIKLGLIAILSSFKVQVDSDSVSIQFDNKNLTVQPKEPCNFCFQPL